MSISFARGKSLQLQGMWATMWNTTKLQWLRNLSQLWNPQRLSRSLKRATWMEAQKVHRVRFCGSSTSVVGQPQKAQKLQVYSGGFFTREKIID